ERDAVFRLDVGPEKRRAVRAEEAWFVEIVLRVVAELLDALQCARFDAPGPRYRGVRFEGFDLIRAFSRDELDRLFRRNGCWVRGGHVVFRPMARRRRLLDGFDPFAPHWIGGMGWDTVASDIVDSHSRRLLQAAFLTVVLQCAR